MLPNNVSQITLNHPSYGTSPAGFPRLHVELLPKEVGRLIGYDPRTLIQKPKRASARSARGTRDLTPHNVSHLIVGLQNQVQRSIDQGRVTAMVNYLKNAMETGAFADWGAIEVVTSAIPDTGDLDIDHVIRMDSDADYFIADGQHRYCAVLDFVREFPQYADRFTQPVTISILPESKLEVWAGQAFHDRNYYAVAVRAGKALSVDSRDPLNALAKELASHPTIVQSGGIAYERDTLLKGDTRFTSHSVFHRFVKGFLFGRAGIDKSTDSRSEFEPSQVGDLKAYLDLMGECMPWAADNENRDTYLTRSSVVLSALAVVGHDLFASDAQLSEIRARVKALCMIDWRRTNLDFVGVIGSEKDGHVQPASSRPAIDATIRFLRDHLGLTPSRSVTVS